MHWVVTHVVDHIPCEWLDLSTYDILEIVEDGKTWVVNGRNKSNDRWENIKRFANLRDAQIWCRDNIPVGKNYG